MRTPQDLYKEYFWNYQEDEDGEERCFVYLDSDDDPEHIGTVDDEEDAAAIILNDMAKRFQKRIQELEDEIKRLKAEER